MMRRFSAVLITILLILSAFPVCSPFYAEDSGLHSEDGGNGPREELCAHDFGAWLFDPLPEDGGVRMYRLCALCGEEDALCALWQTGAIDPLTGEDAPDGAAFRTAEGVRANELRLVTPARGWQIAYFAYDGNGAYLGNGSHDLSVRRQGSGIGVSAEKIVSLYPDTALVRAELTKDDLSTVCADDLPLSGVRFYGKNDVLPAAGLPAPDDFTPVMRFAVASDVHIRDASVNAMDSDKMLDALLAAVYAYSDAQEDYAGLDGLFFTGDNTQTASETEQRYFFETVSAALREGTASRAVMGNHEFFGTGRYTEESFVQAPQNFEEFSGYDSPDAHLTVGGYHFIFMSNDCYEPGKAFSDEKLLWLKGELDAAVSEDESGRKPVFVFQHEPPEGAVGGAVRYASDTALTELLSNYPQVVDFSGHTHFPMTGPYSVWQRDFTAVSVGSLCFSLVPIIGHPAYGDMGVFGDIWYEDYPGICPFDRKGGWIGVTEACPRSAGLFYFVEIDASDRIRLVIYNLLTDSVLGDPIWVGNVGDPDEFNLTVERGYTAARPAFEENAQIRVLSREATVLRLAVPHASCATDPVQNYRADFYREGEFVCSKYALSDDFFGEYAYPEVDFDYSGLDPSTNYEIRVYAVSYWGLVSEPLTLCVSTKDENALNVLSVGFSPEKGAYNKIDGRPLESQGAPQIVYDRSAGRFAAILDGSSAYLFDDVGEWLDTCSRGMSVELVVKIDGLPPATVYLFSDMEYGGLGFDLKAYGSVGFQYHAGGAYVRAAGELPLGEYVHLVGAYDGRYVYMYINGTLAEKKEAKGAFTQPKDYAKALCLGGDPAVGCFAGKFFTGSVIEAGLYSRALTEEEVLLRNEEWRAVKEIDPEHEHIYENGVCTVCGKSEPSPADVNTDGVLTIADVTELLNILSTLTDPETADHDLDGDGSLTISDVTALLDLLAELPAE